jgi:Protein ChrB, N-terminal
VPSNAQWVLLAYRLPREPSTPRIAVWRKLRRVGALQLGDGLVALPLDNRTREQLEWLADEIEEARGEATLWLASTATMAQERALAERMSEAIAAEYQTVLDAVAQVEVAGVPRGRALARLRRTLRAIRGRDYFPPPVAEKARRAVEELGASVETSP